MNLYYIYKYIYAAQFPTFQLSRGCLQFTPFLIFQVAFPPPVQELRGYHCIPVEKLTTHTHDWKTIVCAQNRMHWHLLFCSLSVQTWSGNLLIWRQTLSLRKITETESVCVCVSVCQPLASDSSATENESESTNETQGKKLSWLFLVLSSVCVWLWLERERERCHWRT